MSVNTSKTEQNSVKTNKTQPESVFFQRSNVLIILLACLMVMVGLALMTGEASTESTFSHDVFSIRRIVVAPLLCFVGYMLVIVGIVWRFDK